MSSPAFYEKYLLANYKLAIKISFYFCRNTERLIKNTRIFEIWSVE